tara:strand:+ start:755 stop:1123 length:369 start_codon:yes stop_codon:yes gene_type:complete
VTAFNYARPKATADRLLTRFGQLGAVRRPGTPTGPDYDPTPGVDVDHAARFAVLDYEASEIDGSRVLATDKKVILAVGSLTITPALDDKLVEADGTVYRIIPPLKPLSPAGTVVLFEIQCRR